ncbi:pyridoxamine 5'-phosphate oxidase family protein [Kineococcus radiotolerans]|uniref:Pyridoxamine 5'-phosphate oxidase-related FMN-binding n=1 Tax=Kineococcus radiotolerans (strain ATCC BAA-149 / DSM 14245 / SRS30216) TaxID=266940 RepID=A6W9N8_KINRD|nr:pyridoxamine 5'-phosphate oxidase family protein [Kineococcus radiotolerans]ABS03527.1 pyridoxamine 5'-phosphate oxidase-related FMN-binding [Kineococcus radiotolerans SRS30216 = ATCC BAA-149]
MGKLFEAIDEKLQRWIEDQPMWFTATAPLSAEGRVNVSPRGGDSFSVLGPHRVGWVDFTGSGVETIAHLRENGRICVMFTSFDHRPRIVRLHGTGQVHLPGTAAFEEVVALHPSNPSTRAVITVDVHRVSDSCGWGVPVMDVRTDERDLIRRNAEKKGPDGMEAYRVRKNTRSVDGLPGL